MNHYICPICCGRGLVPAGYYDLTPRNSTTHIPQPEPCRTCGSSGIIWSHPVAITPYKDPLTPQAPERRDD